jgi:hypothetical protein
MGYVTVKSLEGGITLTINRNMWCYLVVTLPLMMVTILGWYGWEFYRKHHSGSERKVSESSAGSSMV